MCHHEHIHRLNSSHWAGSSPCCDPGRWHLVCAHMTSCHVTVSLTSWSDGFSLFYHDLPCCCSINQWFPFQSFTKENFTGKYLGAYWHSRLSSSMASQKGICPGVGRHHLLVPAEHWESKLDSWCCCCRLTGHLGRSVSPVLAVQLMWDEAEMPAGILAAVNVWYRWTRYFPVSGVCETTRQRFLKPFIQCVILMWTGSCENYYSWLLYSWREQGARTPSREFPMHNWSGRN